MIAMPSGGFAGVNSPLYGSGRGNGDDLKVFRNKQTGTSSIKKIDTIALRNLCFFPIIVPPRLLAMGFTVTIATHSRRVNGTHFGLPHPAHAGGGFSRLSARLLRPLDTPFTAWNRYRKERQGASASLPNRLLAILIN
jgi:hypothetical protein